MAKNHFDNVHWSLKNNQDTLRSVNAAYALITLSDGKISVDEIKRFIAEVKKLGLGDENLSENDIAKELYNIRDIMQSDFTKGKEHAISLVKQAQNSNESKKLVLHFAQVAIVANNRIQDCEEEALREICDVLGVNSEEYCIEETA